MRQRWVVHGRVQGVGFRWWVAARAGELGLDGWCRNLADGTVEVEAEGTEDGVLALGKLLHAGPPHARVSACVPHAPSSYAVHHKGFSIRG